MGSPDTLTILHFDDEVNTVLPIPNSLYNHFDTLHPSWVSDVIHNKRFYEFFTLQPKDCDPIRIRYQLTNDYEVCNHCLSTFVPQRDIAIFDLTRMKPEGGTEVVGKTLYRLALALQIPPERLFVLTGYPNLFVDPEGGIEVPDAQKLLKPSDPKLIATKLARLILRVVPTNQKKEGRS